MTEENEDKKEEKDGEKIQDALALLTKKIDEQATRHEHKLAAVDKKLTDLSTPEEEEETWNREDDDEEMLVKKSELKTIVDTAVKKATEAASKAAEKKVDATLSEKAKREQADVAAFKDFPYMNKESQDFNERFFKEVTDEMQRKVQNGRSNADPELLYDAAAVVAQRGRKAGWLVTPEDAERMVDRANARGESFDVQRRKTDTSNKPTSDQIAFATQLGLTEKRFAELFGKTSKSRVNSVDTND
jgi:hypothetical protein